MTASHSPARIPVFALFGETAPFPDVVHCERIADRAGRHGWEIAPHRHDQMAQLFRVDLGGAETSVDGTPGRLGPGGLLYVPPRVVHGFRFDPATEGLVVSLPWPVASRIAPGDDRLASLLARPAEMALTDDLDRALRALAAAHRATGGFRAQRLVAQAQVVLSLVGEAAGEGLKARHRDPRMDRLDVLIASALGRGWRARDYAAALNLTTGHLNRLVRTATGSTLSDHVEMAAMTEACRLMAFTRLGAAEVGYRLGYADPSHFARRFRARTGLTPTAYRSHVAGRTQRPPPESGIERGGRT